MAFVSLTTKRSISKCFQQPTSFLKPQRVDKHQNTFLGKYTVKLFQKNHTKYEELSQLEADNSTEFTSPKSCSATLLTPTLFSPNLRTGAVCRL